MGFVGQPLKPLPATPSPLPRSASPPSNLHPRRRRAAAAPEQWLSSLPQLWEPPDIRTLVLTSGVWPLSSATGGLCLPEPLEVLRDAFEQHYLSLHASRTLAWAHHLSDGELLTTYLPKQYTLRVSGLQLCLLLCFSSCSARTSAQLSEVQKRTMQRTMQRTMKRSHAAHHA